MHITTRVKACFSPTAVKGFRLPSQRINLVKKNLYDIKMSLFVKGSAVPSKSPFIFFEIRKNGDTIVLPALQIGDSHHFRSQIVSTIRYSHAHNPVIECEQVRFELHKSLPQAKPLFKQENLLFVRNLIQEYPEASIKDLCAMVQREKGFPVCTSSMHRAQMRLGLRRKDRELKPPRVQTVGLMI